MINDAFTFIGNDVAFSNVAGQLRFDTASGPVAYNGGVLSGDVNGDAVADFEIALVGITSLTTNDFFL